MSTQPDSNNSGKETVTPSNSTLLGLLMKAYWMALGFLVIVVTAIKMFPNPQENLKTRTVILILNALAMMAARYVDIVHLKGSTTEGVPATMGDFKAYSRNVIIITLLVLAAGFIAYSMN